MRKKILESLILQFGLKFNTMAKTTIENPNSRSGTSDDSRISKIFGIYTNSIIVAIMFIITLICFVVYFCVFQNKLNDTVTTGFIGLMSGLAGYFVASLKA